MASTTTSREYVGTGDGVNGTDLTWAYTFQSYQVADVKVAVTKTDGTFKNVTNFTIPDYTAAGGTITFNSSTTPDADVCESNGAPKSNRTIRIYRETDITTGSVGEKQAKSNFIAGSSIKADDLNNNQKQALYAIYELRDQEIIRSDIRDSAVVNAKIDADAEIEVSKLKDGTTRQLLQTDAAGTGVEWTSNVKVPGTFQSVGTGQFDSTVTIAGAVTVSSTVDGRDLAADGTKLDTIETGATADQTAAEIRTLVGSATDSQVFTDADHSKLDGIEANATADQTNAEIRAAVEAASDSNVFTDADHTKLNGIAASANNYSISSDLLDEDNMATNSATKVASQQSVKAYVDAQIVSGGGQANQNAFSNVAVSGQTTVAADTATDTLTIVGGSNVTVTTDASADSVTIAASGGEITVKNDGSALSTAATSIDFVGAGVTATGSGAAKTVTIPGGGGSALTVSNDGSDTGDDATTINFTGAGVTASGSGATKTITIPGGGGNTSTDFKYLELKAHNNTSGAFSAGAADYELVTKGTTTAITPAQAAALIISVGGVIQEPNTGTSIGSNDGFCIDGSSIHFGANLTEHPDFIIYLQGAGVASIADNTVTGQKIALGSDAAGDIMYYNGTDYVRLGKGTNGHYLKQGTSNAPEWAAVAGTTTFLGLTDTPGSFTAGKHLKVNSGGNALELTDAPAGTITALNNATANELVTVGATTTELDAEANLTFDGSTLAVTGNQTVSTTLAATGQITGRGFECPATVSDDWTIAAGNNAMFPGPMTVAAGKTVTVPANRTLTIV